MQRLVCFAFVACIATTLVVPAAEAQRRAAAPSTAALAQQVTKLQAELAELRKSTTMVPTLASSVQSLSARLEVIAGELGVVQKRQATVPDAVNRIDDLDVRLRAVERSVASLKTELADIRVASIPEPGDSGPGGGGVTYKGGFAWSTADGKHAIKLGGYAQMRHETLVNEDLDDILSTGFRMRRARFGASGKLGDKDRFKMLFSLRQDVALLDLVVDHEIRKELVVRVGQYKVQHGRNFITSSRRLAFPERSVGVNAFRYDRDIQLGVHGRLFDGRVGYYAGVGNGAGKNQVNDNIDLMLNARVDAVALGERFKLVSGDIKGTDKPSLMVGASVVHDLVAVPDAVGDIALETTDVDANGERDNVRVISAAVDATFRYRGVEATVEAMLRYEKWGTIFEGNPTLSAVVDGSRKNRNHVGFFGQLTYMALPDRMLVGARAGHWRLPFLGVSGQSSKVPVSDRVLELELVAQLYQSRGRVLGLQYTYNDFNAKDGPDPENDKFHRVILEGQLSF